MPLPLDLNVIANFFFWPYQVDAWTACGRAAEQLI
jgi:hypothetical protein